MRDKWLDFEEGDELGMDKKYFEMEIDWCGYGWQRCQARIHLPHRGHPVSRKQGVRSTLVKTVLKAPKQLGISKVRWLYLKEMRKETPSGKNRDSR